ncbi:hypothetical protein STCU_11663 [Strigomonas culicis]|uniref:Uncharacterized protein n=1 Tax=Strigomonas culicis TaxID=28005 RepID=S9TD30_9TRYP|nr:hypothetical protein STCU_11663 [Strigomonas culicis]|eukprot:EPY15937.1 hypothetical protein STCU_11663 [Strigomonas culicis]
MNRDGSPMSTLSTNTVHRKKAKGPTVKARPPSTSAARERSGSPLLPSVTIDDVVRSLIQENAEMITTIPTLQHALETKEVECDKLRAEVHALRQELDAVATNMTSGTQAMSHLQAQCQEHMATIAVLKKQNEQLQGMLANHEHHLQSGQGQPRTARSAEAAATTAMDYLFTPLVDTMIPRVVDELQCLFTAERAKPKDVLAVRSSVRSCRSSRTTSAPTSGG